MHIKNWFKLMSYKNLSLNDCNLLVSRMHNLNLNEEEESILIDNMIRKNKGVKDNA